MKNETVLNKLLENPEFKAEYDRLSEIHDAVTEYLKQKFGAAYDAYCAKKGYPEKDEWGEAAMDLVFLIEEAGPNKKKAAAVDFDDIAF
jgi:hypothetical protein